MVRDGAEEGKEGKESNEAPIPLPEATQQVAGELPINRFYVVLFQSGDPDDPFGDLNRLMLQFVQEELDKKIGSPKDQTEIDIWIDSPGGSATVAYKLFLDFQSRCRKLRMVVPDYAKSAATLLVLGGDEIYMAPAAELGPLDAQIDHPDREGITVSALEVASVFDFMGAFATDYIVSGGGKVKKYTGLPRSVVLREFGEFAARFLKPPMGKLDPHLIFRATNELDLAQKYAEAMLEKRRIESGWQVLESAKKVAHQLVRHYPAHEYVIGIGDADQLGLPVKDIRAYENWENVHSFHASFRHELFFEDGGSILKVWNDDDLETVFRSEEEEDGTESEGGTGNANSEKKGEAHEEEPNNPSDV